MQQLLWCFFSFSGRLARLPFAMGMGVTILLSVGLQRIIKNLLSPGLTVPPGPPTRPTAIALVLAALILFWPTAALQIKRLNDLGYGYKTFIGAALFGATLLVMFPSLGLLTNIVYLVWLVFGPSRRSFDKAS